jgi:integrase
VGELSWQAQIHQALLAIDHRGESSPIARHWPNGQLDQVDTGIYRYETFAMILDRALAFTDWLAEVYPDIRRFAEVKPHMTAEFLEEKLATVPQAALWTWAASLRQLQAGLYARRWIVADIVPAHLSQAITHQPRGAYSVMETQAIERWVTARSPEYGQALRFILSSGARISETLQLRSDKIFIDEKQVMLKGKGGRVRRIRVLRGAVLHELDLSRRFVYLRAGHEQSWKDGLERAVRQACDELGFKRRGVHGFRATAASEYFNLQRALGYSDREARQGLTRWLGHAPGSIDVTYVYVPRRCGMDLRRASSR